MNKNMLLVLAAGAALYIMSRKASAAAVASAPSPVSNNFNNDMWAKILGGNWRSLTQGGASVPFLMRNGAGQVVTSDGKPIDSQAQDILPATYMTAMPVDLTAASGGVDYIGQLGL